MALDWPANWSQTHVHMIVFLLACVILYFFRPRKLLALWDVSFLALSVTMPSPFLFCPLSLRYDRILITLRVILSIFYGLYLLYLLIGSSSGFKLAFIGLVWSRYCDMLDHISFSSTIFLGCYIEFYPVLAFDGEPDSIIIFPNSYCK